MRTTRFRLLLVLAFGLVSDAVGAAEPEGPTSEQIEADWLRQEELRIPGARTGKAVDPEDDAAGGVDGVTTGTWGFHTDSERDPWWQVDLGRVARLDRVVIFNRCDAMAARNARITVRLSTDGRDFQLAHRHDGTVFYGHNDGKPLVVPLAGAAARFVRLGLEGVSYFHLDEVVVHAVGDPANMALGKPATQSSTSPWSASHQPQGPSFPTAQVLARGQRLAGALQRLGADVRSNLAELDGLEQALSVLTSETPAGPRRALHLRAHWAVRALAFQNPLLNFDSIIFVKRAPGQFPHMSDQHYGWWSRPGGGVLRLEGFKTGRARVVNLTADMPPGSFDGLDLSYDARRLLFAYCRHDPGVADREKDDKATIPEPVFYHVHEMNADGSGRRALTRGRYDDFDPRYLPGGDIAFLSTRKGLALQLSADTADATRAADRPDSYVRCGGDRVRPVPVFTLHGMGPDGRPIRPLSAFENFEWSPSVAADGRILYTRWDYIDRFNGHFFSLWSSNPDGTNPQLVYGNYTVRPQVVCEARAIPGSSKLVVTAGAHHSITGGTLCLLDRTRGTEEEAPLTRLTPEVVFPETGGWPEHYYLNPWPLSEEFFLVAWSDRRLPPHCRATEQDNPANAAGLYLLDAFGNQELLYRDPAISSLHPIPLAPRPEPPRLAPVTDPALPPAEGRLLVQDVRRGLGDAALAGAVRRLRVVAVPPKVQLTMNAPVLGVSAEDPGKYVLGTVPVEADGSAYLRVPSGVPLLFQALDASGRAVQTMRSLTHVMPGQTLACVGCHEHRDTAPPLAQAPLAARREPSRIATGPEGSWPLRYDRLVQPVLDRLCVSCHAPDAPDPAAARIDLTASRSYETLLGWRDSELKTLAFERDRSEPGQGVAMQSRLWALLDGPIPHHGAALAADDRDRLLTWLDTYAQRTGSFSPEQERDLNDLRNRLAPLLHP